MYLFASLYSEMMLEIEGREYIFSKPDRQIRVRIVSVVIYVYDVINYIILETS